MAQDNEKAAHRGNGGDLRNAHSGRGDGSVNTDRTWSPQERLVGVAVKNSRSRFECYLRTFEGGVRRVVLTIREANGTGGFKDRGPLFVFAPDKIEELKELMDDAKAAWIAEGSP